MVSDSCFRNTEGTPRMCPNKSAPCGGNRLVTASDAPKRKYNIPHAEKVHSAQNLNPKEECEAAGQHTPKSQNILEHTHAHTPANHLCLHSYTSFWTLLDSFSNLRKHIF